MGRFLPAATAPGSRPPLCASDTPHRFHPSVSSGLPMDFHTASSSRSQAVSPWNLTETCPGQIRVQGVRLGHARHSCTESFLLKVDILLIIDLFCINFD